MIYLKRIFSIILVSSIAFTATVSAQKTNQFDKNGKRTGVWKKFYNNNKLRYSGEFKAGKEIGVFKFYNIDSYGTPAIVKEFSSKSDSAFVKFYTPKGKVKSKGWMIGKNRVGKWMYYFEHHVKSGTSYKERQRMPASQAKFDEYTINIDISSFSQDDIGEEKYKSNFNMLSLQQLKDTIPTLKVSYDEFIESRAKNLFLSIDIEDLHSYPDSLKNKDLSLDILSNFDLREKVNVLTTAVSKMERTLNNNKANKETLKNKRKYLNLYDIEYYNRIAFSLSCLILFFIGAPLGSIIRKGGMGLPMILAISIYVLYFFSNTFGRNLAEESSLTAITGSWLSVALMFPLALTLTIRATQDKGLFNVSSFFAPITQFFKKLFSKEKTT